MVMEEGERERQRERGEQVEDTNSVWQKKKHTHSATKWRMLRCLQN